jgi:hypothetical protein
MKPSPNATVNRRGLSLIRWPDGKRMFRRIERLTELRV